MKKRVIMLTALAVAVCGIFAGCSKTGTETKKDNYEITYLLDKGVDLHSYQPTAEDIAKIANCDLFVYVGGESDGWVDDALKESKNDKMQVVNLLETLGKNVKPEEVVEGMQEEDEHDHDHEDADHDHEDKDKDHDHEDADHDHHHEEETEYDEHVWLSLRNATALVNTLAEKLQTIDPENKDYLVDDYGLKYYAAFVGCSAETEASFETVAFLAKKTDDLKLKSVLVIENSDQKIAKKIVETTKDKNQNIVVLNSMQSITNEDIANGATYLSIMESNLKALASALK